MRNFFTFQKGISQTIFDCIPKSALNLMITEFKCVNVKTIDCK